MTSSTRQRSRRELVAICAAAIVAAMAPGAASAAPQTVGQAGYSPDGRCPGGVVLVGEDGYLVPADGTITAFQYQSQDPLAPAPEGPFDIELLVLRPQPTPFEFEVVGTSAVVRDPSDGQLTSVAAGIPAQAGDYLGVWVEDEGWQCLREAPGEITGLAVFADEPEPGDVVSLFAIGEGLAPNVQATLETGPGPTGPTCFGLQATIYRGSGYPGTGTASPSDPMIVKGTAGDDVILTARGDDVVDGAGGDDVICSERGNDKVRGGAGNDLIFASVGEDDLGGQSGHDDVRGGQDNDRINGGEGDDRVRGGDGSDILNGGDGDDRVQGGFGDDVLAGNDGYDDCRGGGGAGIDRVTLAGSCEIFAGAVVSNNTAATSGAADKAVVAAAEAEGSAWTDGAATNPATEKNPAALMPDGVGGSDDVEGGNITEAGDR